MNGEPPRVQSAPRRIILPRPCATGVRNIKNTAAGGEPVKNVFPSVSNTRRRGIFIDERSSYFFFYYFLFSPPSGINDNAFDFRRLFRRIPIRPSKDNLRTNYKISIFPGIVFHIGAAYYTRIFSRVAIPRAFLSVCVLNVYTHLSEHLSFYLVVFLFFFFLTTFALYIYTHTRTSVCIPGFEKGKNSCIITRRIRVALNVPIFIIYSKKIPNVSDRTIFDITRLLQFLDSVGPKRIVRFAFKSTDEKS